VGLIDLLLGKPIANDAEKHERVGAFRGVPILGLDALASAAYGPEALLTVLLPLGVVGLSYVLPLTLAIVVLLVIVCLSYAQTIRAYPNGGGSYTVAKENLGPRAGVIAGSALALDYLLNVAVAIAAGVGALVSAVPPLLPYTVPLCLAVLVLITIINWRGVCASGGVFAVPTYLFVAALFAILVIGGVRALAHGGTPIPVVPPHPTPAAVAAPTLWLLLRSAANGTTAMTGIEAVSNGVPIFRPPATSGARKTLAAIATILVVLLVGVAVLCRAYHVTATVPGEPGYESILSQLAGAVLGRGIGYTACMTTIFIVLALSANTSFADFPRLARLLAIDGYLPEPFEHRGRRLAFSYGLIVLAVLSGLLLVAFGGVTDRLIPLFAIGALLAFTMSQAGMVVHWHRLGVHGPRLWINAFGATSTAIMVVLVLVSKFVEGAWISAVIVGLFVALLWGVRRHHDRVERALRAERPVDFGAPRPRLAIVPVLRWDAMTLKGLQFATGFADEVIAVQVLTGDRPEDDLASQWAERVEKAAERAGVDAPRLVVLQSEYRKHLTPLLCFVSDLAESRPDLQIAVIVPELAERRWYHSLLHTHMASILRAMLLVRGGPEVVIISAPWFEKEAIPSGRAARLVQRATPIPSR
jgi:amino acid transporter